MKKHYLLLLTMGFGLGINIYSQNNLPEGPYQKSCINCVFDEETGTLKCECQPLEPGAPRKVSTLENADQCDGNIENVDGKLVCVNPEIEEFVRYNFLNPLNNAWRALKKQGHKAAKDFKAAIDEIKADIEKGEIQKKIKQYSEDFVDLSKKYGNKAEENLATLQKKFEKAASRIEKSNIMENAQKFLRENYEKFLKEAQKLKEDLWPTYEEVHQHVQKEEVQAIIQKDLAEKREKEKETERKQMIKKKVD